MQEATGAVTPCNPAQEKMVEVWKGVGHPGAAPPLCCLSGSNESFAQGVPSWDDWSKDAAGRQNPVSLRYGSSVRRPRTGCQMGSKASKAAERHNKLILPKKSLL